MHYIRIILSTLGIIFQKIYILNILYVQLKNSVKLKQFISLNDFISNCLMTALHLIDVPAKGKIVKVYKQSFNKFKAIPTVTCIFLN